MRLFFFGPLRLCERIFSQRRKGAKERHKVEVFYLDAENIGFIMYSGFEIAKKYFEFYFSASNGRGHGIHSPFVFDFVRNILNDRKNYPGYATVENLRKKLLHDKTSIEVEDFGAGSQHFKSSLRRIDEIARKSASSVRQGKMLFKICHHYQPDRVVELGTSLGISAAYMSFGNPKAGLFTMEGSGSTADVAEKNFKQLDIKNIEIIRGPFEEKLPGLISRLKHENGVKTMVYLDGNHQKEPTLMYFNMLLPATSDESFFVLDDIHWSKEMEDAWNEIKNDPRAMLTLDLFFLGIVFFKKEFKVKQHFDLRGM